MGKHVNTKVKCFGCSKDFTTVRLKSPDEHYDCPKCKHTHVAVPNEVDGGWIHSDAESRRIAMKLI